MYNRTAKFDAAVQKSHTIATKVEVYANGALVRDISLVVIDGNITIDDVAIHRRCTVTLTDPDGTLTPATASSLLSPLGNEIKLYRGIDYKDGTSPELLPVGVFGISDVRLDDSGQKYQIQLTGYDRARKVQRARFPTEYVVAQGTNYVTAITALLASRFPGIVTSFPATTSTTPRLVFETGSDPWKAAQDMAASIGMDLYFDPTGTCIMVPVTSTGIPVWTYAEGSSAMLLYANRRLTDENTYNHVVITGETSGVTSPIRAELSDTDPNSPTYIYGPYGDVVTFEASSFITTLAQAQAAAQLKLVKVLGVVEQLDIQNIVHPAHETGDLVQVTRADSKVNAVYLLGKITLPMVHDRAMACTARQRIL